jgi:hypothetical protein
LKSEVKLLLYPVQFHFQNCFLGGSQASFICFFFW